MEQDNVWENEYRGESKLITKHNEPQATFLRFLKYHKKVTKSKPKNLSVFDAGCGTGRNSNYLAMKGAKVQGVDISPSAIRIAKERAREMDLDVDYSVLDLGVKQKFKNDSLDLVIDVTSSNSLNEKGREIFLSEAQRGLKGGGYFFVRALSLEGDKNAKYLVKNNPGPEYDTYKMPGLGLVERVFSREDFQRLYSKYFKIEKLIKETGYTRFSNQNYKRYFWVAYLRKK